MNMLCIFHILSAIFVASLKLKLISSAPVEDEVINLNLLSWKPTFKHYSGYLDAGDTKFLHYWFLESQNDPSKDPLVLWLNGGPGCSSLDGLLTEHGPFLISAVPNLNLKRNAFSWNTFSNILYLESPAGVGFSYSTDKNYTTSDDETALHNHEALKDFFKKFPEYSRNDFYITGESYAGIYLPTLAVRLIKDDGFNFKGMAVGNGLSSYSMNYNSIVYFAYDHGLIGEDLYLKLVQLCCKGANSTIGNCDFIGQGCTIYFNELMNILGSLNIYNLYDKCYQSSSAATNNNNNNYYYNNNIDQQQQLLREQFIRNTYFKFAKGPIKRPFSITPPCINDRPITKYLNDPQTRKDLHIPDSVRQWSICSSLNYVRIYDDMKDQYLELLKSKKYRVLVYNGDVDMACNFLGDQWFVQSLGLKEETQRQMWYYIDLQDKSKQVAGFAQKYQNLTFVTIKGAGHMVPSDKPYQALNMFANFLAGLF